MERLHLDLIGERILVECGEASIREGILEAAPLLACSPFADEADLVYTFRARSDTDPFPDQARGRSEAVSAEGDFVFCRSEGERWLVVGDRSAARLDLERGRVAVFVHPDHAGDPWVIGHRLFFLPLIVWMRHRGRYPLHGSCFVAGGQGVVVCGPSGAGKSSATLAAVASGCPFVADDMLFALRREGSIVLRPFPEPLKVGEGTSRFFPELRDRWVRKGRKLLFPEEALPPPGRIAEVRPALLLFPTIVDRERSRFERLSGGEAMARLLPQSVLPAGREEIEAHIDLLADLVRQAAAYHLLFGRDVAELPARIAELSGAAIE